MSKTWCSFVLVVAMTSCGTDNSEGSNSSSSSTSSSTSGTSKELATIIPDASWDCGMSTGIPSPELGELVFSATVQVGGIHEFGETQYGERRLLDVIGGTFNGSKISGDFLEGGLELELNLPTGTMELEQINILRTQDSTAILMHTCGVSLKSSQKSRFVADFEAPNSSQYAWLNNSVFIGSRTFDRDSRTIELKVFDVSTVNPHEETIKIEDPVALTNQPRDCSTKTGRRGAEIFSEQVSLGSSIAIGASKRGSRNIIPITGGTVSGQFNGNVLPGGADYQLIGEKTVLDARYTLKSKDGEYVLIRNCGSFGALIPQFEARKDGPYAYLNEKDYLSSDPGLGGGGVSITFYEKQ